MAATVTGQQETRRQLYGETLPELPATERLADALGDLGYARDTMSGVVPFDWVEVQAYAALTGADLHPCEASCLVEMSRTYCREVVDGNPLRKAPMERDL